MRLPKGILKERNLEYSASPHSNCTREDDVIPEKENVKPAQTTTTATTTTNNLKKQVEKSGGCGGGLKPLNATRLRPIRQKTRTVVITILDDENICLEFLTNHDARDYVIEVMRITSDGMKVTIYSPNGKMGVPLGDRPPDVSPSAVSYNVSVLPQKYWRKYQYAEDFVSKVKMRTPKVSHCF